MQSISASVVLTTFHLCILLTATYSSFLKVQNANFVSITSIAQELTAFSLTECILSCQHNESCRKIAYQEAQASGSGVCFFLNSANSEFAAGKKLANLTVIDVSRKDVSPCAFDGKPISCGCKKHEWLEQRRNVSFGAGSGQYGNFSISHSGHMTELRLVHHRGGVTCHRTFPLTNFGCDAKVVRYSKPYISVFITNTNNNIIIPQINSRSRTQAVSYLLPGFNANSPELIFQNINFLVDRNEMMRIWYGESLFFDRSTKDNTGKSWVGVYAKICNL